MQKSIRQRMRKKEAVQPGTTALPQVAGASSRRITADRGACILVLAFAIVLPNLTGESILQLGKLDYLLAGVMLAVGLNIVLGFAGQLFLGPAAIFGLAAYAAAYAANQVTALQSFPAMVVISLGVSIVASLFVAIPALRIGHFYLGMITLVLASLVPTVASQLNLVGGQSGLSLIANPSFVQSPTGYALYLLGLLIVIVLLGCSWLIKSSQLGREFEAMRQSEHLATSIGIHTYRTKVLVFAIASPAAALAAAYYVYSQQFVSPGSVTVNLSIYLLAGVVIGGAGKIVGPAIGVALVLAASEFLGSFSQYEGIVFGALLVSVAVAQAYGLSLASLLRPYLANAVRLLKPSGGDQTPAVEAFEPRSPVKVLIPSATNGTPTPATASATPGELEAPAAMTPGFGVFPASPRPESTGAKLELRAIRRAFGGNQAVKDVSLTVEQGTVHALVGPNGSGKTTVLNLISKLYRVDGGEVWLNGVRIDNIGAADLARCGLSRTFQTPKLVDQATISTNVLLAAEIAGGGSGVRSMLRLPGSRRLLREAHLGAAEAIRTVRLDGIQRVAGSVPHGTQRLIEVARAVASKPRFLLLDEPAAGLSPAEVATLKGTVRSFADAGMGVLLVEHNMRLVLDLADEITVLDEGEVVARGDPQQVIRDPIVAKVYLGERAESKSRNAIEATSARLETSGAVSGGVGLEASGALRVEGLHAGYGAVRVVEGVSLHAERGEIVGVLGRNGVGKTTLMSAIAGLRFGCNSGAVTCFGRQLQEASPVEVVSSGIALVPEGRRIFKDMTVAENLEIGAYTVRRGARHEVRKRLEHVLTVFPPLTRILGSVSGNLSGGQQQMLAVGQALMAQPSVLLLDEPTAGLAPLVVESLFGAIMQLRDEGLAIVVVEQDLERALRLCNRYYVMDSGRMMVEGNTVDAEIEYLTQLILGSEPSAVLSAQKLP